MPLVHIYMLIHRHFLCPYYCENKETLVFSNSIFLFMKIIPPYMNELKNGALYCALAVHL